MVLMLRKREFSGGYLGGLRASFKLLGGLRINGRDAVPAAGADRAPRLLCSALREL